MTTPPPVVTPPTPPTPVPPPTTPGQVAAYMLYQQQLHEFNNPRPTVVPPAVVGIVPVPKTEPKWVNPCVECGAVANTPCVGPLGHPLNYLHAPRLILNG